MIYADILLIVNLYLDFFLLRCVKRFLRLKTRGRRLALGALVGAVCALLALLDPPPGLSLLWGLASALLVSVSALCPAHPRLVVRAALCFWVFSLGLAGFFLFLLRFFTPGRIALLGSVVYFDLSLPLLFFFTCGAYALLWTLEKLLPAPPPKERFLELELRFRGKRVSLWARADTACDLREPFSGLPVLLCRKESLKALFPEGLSEKEPGLRLIPYGSLGGRGLLPAFRPEEVRVKRTGRVLDCWAALSESPLSDGQFDALLNPDAFPEAFGSKGFALSRKGK